MAMGILGTGFFHSVTEPLPSLDELESRFRRDTKRYSIGASPFAWCNRVSVAPRWQHPDVVVRARASNRRCGISRARSSDLPLYALLGGTDRRVRAYASGLEFHLDDDAVAEFYDPRSDDGFTAFKVKVGHPDLDWDIRRLQLVQRGRGPECTLMADANEAWSPKEAIRRLHAYGDAGIELYWIEDPCLRDDIEGLRSISEPHHACSSTGGEYLDLSGKRRLLEPACR